MTTYLFLVIETKDIVCEKYYLAIDRICIYSLFIYNYSNRSNLIYTIKITIILSNTKKLKNYKKL